MYPVSVIALFCEDIREEKDDVVTLIGLMPDNVNVVMGHGGRILSKICLYVRLNFDPEYNLGEVKMNLITPDNARLPLGSIDLETVNVARSQAKARGNPIAGVISRAVLAGVRPATGPLCVEVSYQDMTHLAGALNFEVKEASPSDAPQPS